MKLSHFIFFLWNLYKTFSVTKKVRIVIENNIQSFVDENENMLKEIESISEDYIDVEKDNEILNLTKQEIKSKFDTMENLLSKFDIEEGNTTYDFHFYSNMNLIEEEYKNCSNILNRLKQTSKLNNKVFSFDQAKVNDIRPVTELSKKLTKALDNKLNTNSWSVLNKHNSLRFNKGIWKNETKLHNEEKKDDGRKQVDEKMSEKNQSFELVSRLKKQFERMKNVSKVEFPIGNSSLNNNETNQTNSDQKINNLVQEMNQKLKTLLNAGKVDISFLNDQSEGNKLVKINLINFMEEKLKLYDSFIKNMKKSISLFEKFKFWKSENARVSEKFKKLENSTFANNDRFKEIPNFTFESLIRENFQKNNL